MSFVPEPGQVIRYDFLWHEEGQQGFIHGRKDRPSAIIIVTEPDETGESQVYLCPITHTPVSGYETGIEIPPKLARHLGLDEQASWVKTHEVNIVSWPKDLVPYGVSQAKPGQWIYGMMPKKFTEQIFNQVKENFTNKQLLALKRE